MRLITINLLAQGGVASAALPATMYGRLRDANNALLGTDLLYASNSFSPKAVLEGTAIDFGTNGVKLFHTLLRNDQNAYNALGIACTHTWPLGLAEDAQPTVGQGYGGVSRNVHGSYLLYDSASNVLRMWATNGYGYPDAALDRNTYFYKSMDQGETWTDLGLCLDKNQPNYPEIIGYGNTGVLPDKVNGKYVMLIEANQSPTHSQSDAVWNLYRAEADSLDGPWAITTRLQPQLRMTPTGMAGGACPFYSGGKIHLFYHAGTGQGNFPTQGCYSNSSDGGFTWKPGEVCFPLLQYPYPGTDQTADLSLFEWQGKTYLFATIGNNVEHIDNKLIYLVFNGTKEQLVAGL